MMQNGLGESFWDGLGVEIEACANFKRKLGIRDIFPVPGKNHGTGCSGPLLNFVRFGWVYGSGLL